MCFNAKVSLATYIVGMVGSINLYFNFNLKAEAILYFCVIQMQLVEYFLWINQTCNETNRITTKAGIIINHLEPVALWIGILLYSKNILPDWVNYMMILFLIATYLYTRYVLSDNCKLSHNKNKKINEEVNGCGPNKCTLVSSESGNHLFWAWNNAKYKNTYYVFFLLSLNILAINGLNNGYVLASLITGSFIISNIIYRNTKSIGAMWCFIVAFLPWITPYLSQMKI